MNGLTDLLHNLIGQGDQLAWWQAAIRAAIAFAATWAMLRLAGRRAFAQRNSFDLCVMLLLGAVLSRAVVGATPIPVALAASLALVLLHRLVGWLSARSPGFDRAMGGRPLELMDHGELDQERVGRALITQEDLRSNLRATLQTETLAGVSRVVLERDGKLTFVRETQEKHPRRAASARHLHRYERGANGGAVPHADAP